MKQKDFMIQWRFFFFLFLQVIVYAESPYIYTNSDPVYLDKTKVQIEKFLPAPPKDGDTTDKKDFATILQYQKSRTKEDCERAAAVVRVDFKTFFGPPYGPLSDEEISKIPDTYRQIAVDTDYFVQQIKRTTLRQRPFNRNKNITPCVKLETTLAYPSGHSTISRVLAKLLAFRFPEKKVSLLARAEQIAEDRVMAGVHHPSDIAAGKKLGNKIYDLFLKNKKLMSEIKK